MKKNIARITAYMARIAAPGHRPYLRFTALTALLCTAAFGLADVIVYPGGTSFLQSLLWLPAVYAATMAVIALAALWRPVFAVFMPLYMVLYAAVTYFRYSLGIELDRTAIELTFGTDIGTSMSMVSTPLVLTLAAALASGVLAVVWRWKIKGVRGVRGPWTVVSVAVIAVTGFVPGVADAMCRRQPYNLPSSLTQYVTDSRYPRYYRFNYDNEAAVTDESDLTVVFMLGESVRADHLGINGYARPTTPLLCEEPNVVSFTDIYSRSYFTDRSVPRIMTRADTIDDWPAYRDQSFITLFRNAGYRTVWLANQAETPCLRYYMHETDRLRQAKWNFVANNAKGKFLDRDLLPWYQEELDDSSSPLLLIVMHQLNCHWVYTSKYPDSYERWTPVMTHDEVLLNSREELINAYDNCILYADSIWRAVIDPLRDRNAIVIYLSDHGEALGENGKYLHGADYAPAHYPAAWVWYSDRYAAAHPDRVAALRRNAALRATTTFLFHTILDAASIRTAPLSAGQSLMRPHDTWHER